jgi:Phage integrase family
VLLGPLIVLLGQDGADQTDWRCPIGEDADDVGAAADFPVQPFLGVVGPDLSPGRLREGGNAKMSVRAASVVPIVERWAAGKSPSEWLFNAPAGGPLRETSWKRSVRWREAVAAIGRPRLRVHDLRHTAASVWFGSGADRKVVQRVLGPGSAATTMDLYGHHTDQNLWRPLPDSGYALAVVSIPPMGVTRQAPLATGDGWSRLSESNR